MQIDKLTIHNELIVKLRQQEQTIAQLVTIVASTNRRLEEMERKLNNFDHLKTSSC
ncbi:MULTISPECIES: hypothetical protein [Paraliobacillus]|uniref:hypothetical protein n=1 Tax=Paraliobacillus TaxID=200903 RepID=UPI001300A01F|nr:MULTISPECIES: hypothetical protein [Paraliobacillus]